METPPRNITINISSSTIAKTIVVIFLFILLFLVRDVVLIVLTAVVIASAIEPATKWLQKNKVNRLLAVIFVYAILLVVFLSIIYFFVPTILAELSNYLSNLPKYLNYAQAWLPVKDPGFIENSATIQQISSTSLSLGQSIDGVAHSLTNVSQGFIQTVQLVFGGVLSFILIMVLSFYLAVQENGVRDFLKIVTPIKHEKYVLDLWLRSQHKIGLWMQGQLLLGVTVGIMVFIVLTIAGIKHALLLALLAAIFEIIPVFGPILSAIPGILIAIGERGASFGLIIAALYLLIQQFENHLFYPLVVKKIVGISPIVVILALVVGAKLAGFLGILLSVPLSTTLMEYLRDVEKEKHNQSLLGTQ